MMCKQNQRAGRVDVGSSMLKTLRYGAKNVDVWKGGEAMERT